MARKEKTRSVNAPPRFFRFTSEESPTGDEKTVQLLLDEYEAIRLSDNLGYDHGEAAAIMGISRPTFTRLVNRARKKMSVFLTDGGVLEVRGGKVLFSTDVYCCRACHRPFQWKLSSAPVCPRCSGERVMKAQPSCQHDCHCCEVSIE